PEGRELGRGMGDPLLHELAVVLHRARTRRLALPAVLTRDCALRLHLEPPGQVLRERATVARQPFAVLLTPFLRPDPLLRVLLSREDFGEGLAGDLVVHGRLPARPAVLVE